MADTFKVKYLKKFPSELLNCEATDLFRLLGGPCLIEVQGKNDSPIFISILLHGDEVTGFQAIQNFFKKYKGRELPRKILLFIGNVEAASFGLRYLGNGPDWNRIWSGGQTDLHLMASEVIDFVKKMSPMACLDIHNNSGRNPLYACVNNMSRPFLNLGSAFGRTIVYFTEPKEVMSMAMSKIAPATTIEAGKPGDNFGVKWVENYIDEVVKWKSVPTIPREKLDLRVFHTLAKIKLHPQTRVIFGEELEGDADVCFIDNFDTLNFSYLDSGHFLGLCKDGFSLLVVDNDGRDRSGDYFTYDNGEIRTKVCIIPSMFTQDLNVAFQDCLGYLMEDY